MPVNLEGPRRKMESEMTDVIQIMRPGRLAEGTFNRDTLDYEYDVDHDTEIYSGIAMISPQGQEGRPRPEGGETTLYELYKVRIPLSADEPFENDYIIVTSSLRDPDLAGKTLFIHTVFYTSFAVSRSMFADIKSKRNDP